MHATEPVGRLNVRVIKKSVKQCICYCRLVNIEVSSIADIDGVIVDTFEKNVAIRYCRYICGLEISIPNYRYIATTSKADCRSTLAR